jgi:nitroreductase
MEFQEVLKARRSCRAYAPDPVSDEQLQQLISACQWAPSPLNLQPWEFIIITEPEVKAKVAGVAEEARQAVLDQDGPGWAKKYPMDFLDQAPVLLAVLANRKKNGLGGYFNQPTGAMMAVAAGIENLMLAAAEMGLGTLWFTFFDPVKMGAALGVPEHLEVAGVIPLGKATDNPAAPPRKDPKVFRGAYGR